MTQRSPAHFRKWLLVELASTVWPRKIALFGADPEKDKDLAVRLGVQEDLLAEAIGLVRLGFRTRETEPSKLVQFRIQYSVELMKLVKNLSVSLNCPATSLVRNLLHAAMQTTYEPSRQVFARKRKYLVVRGKPVSGRKSGSNMRISQALKQAIQYRALAYGAPPHAYVRGWIVDLVEGKLGHIDIQPVRLGQMFDSVDAYVLPVLEQKA